MTPECKLTERSMVEHALARLGQHKDIAASTEVPLGGRFVDLVFVRSDRVNTVEFKLGSWRRALRQARDHLLGADRAYVCMPRRDISEEMECAFHEAGVGLLFFDEQGEWPFDLVIEGQADSKPWQVARKQLIAAAHLGDGEELDVYV